MCDSVYTIQGYGFTCEVVRAMDKSVDEIRVAALSVACQSLEGLQGALPHPDAAVAADRLVSAELTGVVQWETVFGPSVQCKTTATFD